MKPSPPVIVLMIALLVSGVTSCSKPSGGDKTIGVSENDADMNAAIAKARSTLPQFWQVFEHPDHGESDFCLKVKITDKNEVEHFWAADIERTNNIIKSTISNDPEFVHNVKNGDRITIPEADISDWLYMKDKKMVGNYTLRAMFKEMKPDEVEKYKKMMVDP
ncbi:MAG: DUF2314 domain-containing protein [Verrucomicrobia bacterium]|nr:DUF2314 domain-containing protein [Verrucomicrobiota bacterium]